jgi:hypothetical protein
MCNPFAKRIFVFSISFDKNIQYLLFSLSDGFVIIFIGKQIFLLTCKYSLYNGKKLKKKVGSGKNESEQKKQ